jgi:phage FluMu gp28-like protein
MIVSSTPIGGPERKFWQIMNDTSIVRGQKLWSTHTCDIHRAIAEGRIYDLESERAAADPFSFRQEMLLEWLDGEQTYFSQELIASCEDPRASAIGYGYQGGRVFIGNDIAIRGDLWVAWVLEASDDFQVIYKDLPSGQKISYYTGELITREVVTLHRTSFAEHDRQIARLMMKYDVVRLSMDSTGIGDRSTEEMQRLYGSKIEGVNFTLESKGGMATLGLEVLTERRALLPQDHPEISLDFRKLQRVVSAAGNVRFQAARDANGHSDRCWAFLMALEAAITPVQEIAYEDGGIRESWEELGSFVC